MVNRFARMLFPLLKYGRERDGIDLSELKLSHHRMRELGQQQLNLGGAGVTPLLQPLTEVGSGQVQDKHKQLLAEIVAAINDLFEGDLTPGDTVSFFEAVKTKMMEAPVLVAQAAANPKAQFMNSPSLNDELMNAIMDAMAAHQSMSKQALNSDSLRARLLA